MKIHPLLIGFVLGLIIEVMWAGSFLFYPVTNWSLP